MDATAKQQVVERLKAANNVLVTVSANPSVDQLAAAIALTLMVNAMEKHATAVFSGTIPDTMQFLNPGKTLENTVDSLRDFIIALDKNKADKLRYKVEDDVVKIFITPYRTRISESDLQFTQGDYNVDVVVALGVHKKEDLDKVIVEHGRILHDAPVICVNVGMAGGNLGSINWDDNTASSLSEMLMNVSEALQPGLVTEQVATALLTGIVSETDRFSNEKTTPKVMTMAAQLMAAGANQQLIASHIHPTATNASVVTDGEVPKPVKKDPSEMDISHDDLDDLDDVDESKPKSDDSSADKDEPSDQPTEKKLPKDDAPKEGSGIDLPAPPLDDEADADSDDALPNSLPPGPIADMIHDTEAFAQAPKQKASKPVMSGTFSATADDANEATEIAQSEDAVQSMLSHNAAPTVGPMTATEPEEPLSGKPSWNQLDTPVAPPVVPVSNPSPPVPVSKPPVEDFSPLPAPLSPPKPEFQSPPLPAPTPAPFTPPQVEQTLVNNAPLPLNVPPVAGENNPALQAEKLDGETLENIDSSARGLPQPPVENDLESARHAVEAAMGMGDSADPTPPPLQGIGINGRLDIHPENHLPAAPADVPSPPATPPPFGMPPTAQTSPVSSDPFAAPTIPTPSAMPPLPQVQSQPLPAPQSPFQPTPSPAQTTPMIGEHEGGYMTNNPQPAAPAPAAPGNNQPSADDFTLPSIT